MAEENTCWGIEIGQAALKAMKLRYDENAGQVIAEAFDLVAHPKILSQPDAIPEQIIPQSLETFLSRNNLRDARIALSVPGQNALARFIQLPPVESSKIAQIVEYEARQQIPFALEEVIWDYQPLGGGMEESGFTLEAEVGLFAMKRDQVENQMRPFNDRKIELDLVQIAPLALYNFLTYDRAGMRPGREFEADDEYQVVCDLGAENSTLLISNGEKIWIRNVPIGGNKFTRALVKEMKLTFAKAEHLKQNATKAPDPRAVFQALRPVFNEYASEIQRSIGYFSSVNREAKITKVLGVGNGFKLAGLQKFLQQNLQYPVERVERLEAVVGDKVLGDDVFRENVAGMVVPYGLALQGLGRTRIHTSLVPPEIVRARTIRRKKPWAVLAASALLFFLMVSAVGYGTVYESVGEARWGTTEAKVKDHNGVVSAKRGDYEAKIAELTTIDETGKQLTRPVDTRDYWPELYRAISAALPADPDAGEKPLEQRKQIRITSTTATKEEDLATWYAGLDAAARDSMPEDAQVTPPAGPGYVVTLGGVHYYNHENVYGKQFLRETLLNNLRQWTLSPDGTASEDPAAAGGVAASGRIPVGKIGIGTPVLTNYTPDKFQFDPEAKINRRRGDKPGAAAGGRGGMDFGGGFGGGSQGLPAGTEGGFGRPPAGGRGRTAAPDEQSKLQEKDRYRFQVQFTWVPTAVEARTDEPPAAGESPAEPPAE